MQNNKRATEITKDIKRTGGDKSISKSVQLNGNVKSIKQDIKKASADKLKTKNVKTVSADKLKTENVKSNIVDTTTEDEKLEDSDTTTEGERSESSDTTPEDERSESSDTTTENVKSTKEVKKTKKYILNNFDMLSTKFCKKIFKKCVYKGFRRAKSVPVFTRFDAYDILTSRKSSYFTHFFNYTKDEADFFLNLLIDNSEIIGCDVYDKNGEMFEDVIKENEPCSLQRERFQLEKFIECDLNLKKTKNVFILLNTPMNYKLIINAILIILLILFLSSFQIWPQYLKNKTYILVMFVIVFTASIFLLGAVRLVIFIITYFTSYPGIWIFPRLFAEVGFFESFQPLWERAKITDFDTKNK